MKASGILLHITSLPSTYGMGSLGEVDKFVKFLVKSGVKFWQILPITPPACDNNPYHPYSSFAGNVFLIDFDSLVDEGLLNQLDILECKKFKDSNFELAKQNKINLLRVASKNFYKQNPPSDFEDFCDTNSFWLNDFSLFCALKHHFNEVAWIEFPDENIRLHKPDAVAFYSDKLSDEIDFVKFCQYIFFKQWEQFRQKLSQNDISLIGDIPFYVAYDSVDVWANTSLFELDEQLRPKNVCAIAPSRHCKNGQVFSNAVYNFKQMKKEGFGFFVKKYQHIASLVDVLHIEQFANFDSFFWVKCGQTSAKKGKWTKSIGMPAVNLLKVALLQTQAIVDSFGVSKRVLQMRDKCGFKGAKILQHALDGKSKTFLPDSYLQNSVAYLSRQDTNTAIGWWNSLSQHQRATVLEHIKTDNSDDINFKLLSLLAQSSADLVVYSMQDVAGDSTDSCVNNWTYMAKNEHFSNINAKRLHELNLLAGRIENNCPA